MKTIQAIKKAFLALTEDRYLGNMIFYVGVMMYMLELFVVSVLTYYYLFNIEIFSSLMSILMNNWSEHLVVVVTAVVFMWFGKRLNRRIRHEKV